MEGGSPELQVNNLVEPKYRQWVVDQVEEQGEVEKQELVITGAEIAGCSPLTTDRYLRKLTSTAGPLRQYRGEDGVWKVGLRQQETGEVSKNGLSSRAANGHRPTRVNGKAVTHGG